MTHCKLSFILYKFLYLLFPSIGFEISVHSIEKIVLSIMESFLSFFISFCTSLTEKISFCCAIRFTLFMRVIVALYLQLKIVQVLKSLIGAFPIILLIVIIFGIFLFHIIMEILIKWTWEFLTSIFRTFCSFFWGHTVINKSLLPFSIKFSIMCLNSIISFVSLFYVLVNLKFSLLLFLSLIF